MITNYFIPPHSYLSPYIDQYILSTSENAIVQFGGPWPGSNETSLCFHLADKPTSHVNECSNSNIEKKDIALVGLLTRYNGLVHFYGRYHTFIIHFKPNGLNRIFGIPVYNFTDNIYSADQVFGNGINDLYNQLLNAPNIHAMAQMVDHYLISMIRRQKEAVYKDGISAIINDLQIGSLLPSVTQYAANANMSVRNFERKFSEQIGISPRLYFKLARFNYAVNSKLLNPRKTWTAIAYECNYYDQMHLIRDFKQFSNTTPTAFFQSYLDAGGNTGCDENTHIQPGNSELFVHIRRQLS